MFDDLMVWKLLSDFVDIEFRMETTAILSTWNNIFFLWNSLCHKQIAKTIGNISKNVMSLKISEFNTAFNSIADALSRAQFQKFKELAPHADSSPTMVPYEFLIFLNDNIKV
jgi:hypothetical protein